MHVQFVPRMINNKCKIYTTTDVYKKASNHCIKTVLCISSHATGISQQNWSNPERK